MATALMHQDRSPGAGRPRPARLVIALIAALSGLSATRDAPDALVQRGFCEPSFSIDGTVRRNGTGFLLYDLGSPRHTFLVTAQHLFSVAPPEMPARVAGATCKSPATGRSYATGPAILIQGAHPMGPLNELKDLAVFPVQGRSPGLTLADRDVEPGAVVWLLARVKGGAETASLLHRAIAGRADGYLVYRFDDQTIGLDQTSGAAVLNSTGEVVGVNVGYGRAQNGALVGVADQFATLRAVVAGLP